MTEYDEGGWHDAGLNAYYAWESMTRATDALCRAHAMLAMDEAMGDLATFLPGYDIDIGGIPDEADVVEP